MRCIVFREGKTWYGSALEFNIVVHADTRSDAFVELDQAIKEYVDTVRQSKIRESVLNQDASSEYSQLWKDLNSGKVPQLKKIEDEHEVAQPVEVAFFGYMAQPA